jgi:hypothetical protein
MPTASAAQVAQNSLTGASIEESTLGRVPQAAEARRAQDAVRLGALPATSYLSRLRTVQVASLTDTEAIKGPLAAPCPAGFRIISGGAAVEGVPSGVAILRNAPSGSGEWVAAAAEFDSPGGAWRLVVTAICAEGGA